MSRDPGERTDGGPARRPTGAERQAEATGGQAEGDGRAGGLDEHSRRGLDGLRRRRIGVEHASGQSPVEQDGELAGQLVGLGGTGAPGEVAYPGPHEALCSTERPWTSLPGLDSAAVLMNAHPW